MEMGRISEGPPSAGGRLLSSDKCSGSCANLLHFHSRLDGLTPPLSALGRYAFPLQFQGFMTLNRRRLRVAVKTSAKPFAAAHSRARATRIGCRKRSVSIEDHAA